LTDVWVNAYKINKLRKKTIAAGAGTATKGSSGPKTIRYLRVEDEYWDGFVQLAEEREQFHGALFRDMYLAFKASRQKKP
jgi:hypothetical protein